MVAIARPVRLGKAAAIRPSRQARRRRLAGEYGIAQDRRTSGFCNACSLACGRVQSLVQFLAGNGPSRGVPLRANLRGAGLHVCQGARSLLGASSCDLCAALCCKARRRCEAWRGGMSSFHLGEGVALRCKARCCTTRRCKAWCCGAGRRKAPRRRREARRHPCDGRREAGSRCGHVRCRHHARRRCRKVWRCHGMRCCHGMWCGHRVWRGDSMHRRCTAAPRRSGPGFVGQSCDEEDGSDQAQRGHRAIRMPQHRKHSARQIQFESETQCRAQCSVSLKRRSWPRR